MENLAFKNMGQIETTEAGGAVYIHVREFRFLGLFDYSTSKQYTLQNITFKNCRSREGAAVAITGVPPGPFTGKNLASVLMDNVRVVSGSSCEGGAILSYHANLSLRNR